MTRRFFTSESVTEGHPDKVSDQISDAILDEILKHDKMARVDAETVVMQGNVLVTGQITTKTYVDIPKVVRGILKGIGLDNARDGLDWRTCGVTTSIERQSPDIARGIDNKPPKKIGSGDQCLVYGYATDETPEFMPMPITLAHAIVRRLTDARKKKILPYLRPDGKSQVTVEYDGGKPMRVDVVVVAAQHTADVKESRVRRDIIRQVVRKAIPKELIDRKTKFIVNGTGRFVIGGTLADTGLTGRKIIVDTYGGIAPSGGGCLSGKDPTKTDRSGQYVARYIAKNIVAAGLAKRCGVQVAYAIGIAEPVSVHVDTFKTGKVSDGILLAAVRKVFDLRPGVVINYLKLRRPIYRKASCYGSFGRSGSAFTWERVDRTADLKRAVKEIVRSGAKS